MTNPCGVWPSVRRIGTYHTLDTSVPGRRADDPERLIAGKDALARFPGTYIALKDAASRAAPTQRNKRTPLSLILISNMVRMSDDHG